MGTKKGDGTCKDANDYASDLDAISSQSGVKLVRGYAASDCDFAKVLLPVAEEKGFKVLLGIWYVIIMNP